MIALALYVVGIAIVLYFRPAPMFNAETGVWKEFGLGPGYTTFPFWMFALVWALLSYVGANFATVFLTGLALQSLPADVVEANISNVLKPVSKSPPPSLPVSAVATEARGSLPGYYVLETATAGPPKYVYFGTSPPTVENVARFSPAGP